ncbi:MAG: DUF4956 domain-containing protein [Clostridiales Family XIII bacterium]|jgi:hypothetical protein|nr:DUF4956 domain-containing protein [Clostridiales Family XIII bacterium]
MFDIITGSVTNGVPSFGGFLICTICSLAFGLIVSLSYMFHNKYSKSLAVTLVLLPATVQIIIMLVNGNIGAGVAVAGAFSLVRFRSIPGSARDICSLFFAMALGFVTGMGYIFYAFTFMLLLSGASLLLTRLHYGQGATDTRVLRITIPESLDYDNLFDDVLVKYTRSAELDKVKTTNMGSLYELTYSIRLKTDLMPKAFIDELRCRNGNLNIMLGREQLGREEL